MLVADRWTPAWRAIMNDLLTRLGEILNEHLFTVTQDLIMFQHSTL
jgi:hypothetical protein